MQAPVEKVRKHLVLGGGARWQSACVRPGCSPAPHRQRTRPGPHSRPKPRNLISSSAGTEVLMASFSCLTCSPEILNKAVLGMHSGLSFMLVWAQDTRKQMFPVHPAERKP